MEQDDRRSGWHNAESTSTEYFSPVRRSPAFDPAAQYRRGLTGATESPEQARRRRRSRRRLTSRLVGAGLVLALGVAAWVGYEPASTKAKTFVLEAMQQEIEDLATAEQNYRSLYGGFTDDRSQLTLAQDGFNNVRVVSASRRSFCLAGDSLLGQKLWYTPDQGLITTACL